jgi:ABC-type sugar transport system ATPase subunit
MAEICLEHVSRVFAGGVTAVRDVCLAVRDRETMVLVGPSGCGKTTILRMVAGLDRPTDGQISIDGRPVGGVAPERRNIAMMFQQGVLYPHLTVRDNLALALRGGGLFGFWKRKSRRREIDDRVRRIAQLLEVEHLLRRMPSDLSGGERQRVALGRALVRKPAAFLLDEPLVGLDAPSRERMRRELLRIRREEPTTTFYVTHDQAEATSLAERIALMNEGRIEQVGSADELYERPANRFAACFFGSPAMNVIEGELIAEGEAVALARGLWKWRVASEQVESIADRVGKRIVCGIRPENLAIRSADGPGLPCSILSVQSLGDRNVIQAKLASGELRENDELIVDAITADRSATTLGLATVDFDMTKAYWFDDATGENLRLKQ